MDTMRFLVFPVRKSGKTGWVAIDLDTDVAYRFTSDRHIGHWCKVMAKRHGFKAEVEIGPLNAIDTNL